jgi:sugar phosphate permease
VLRDRRFWLLLAANMAIMTIYSLWVNWTTVFLVSQHGLTQENANHRLAWIPQIFGTLGGLFGGWLALRGSRTANDVVASRLRASLVGAVLALVTGLIPFAASPAWATVGICASFFAVLIMSVNVYALPLDYFGAGPAAFAVAGLTGSYGVVQVLFSSLAGRVADHAGFGPVLLAVAPLPLIGWLLLWISAKR